MDKILYRKRFFLIVVVVVVVVIISTPTLYGFSDDLFMSSEQSSGQLSAGGPPAAGPDLSLREAIDASRRSFGPIDINQFIDSLEADRRLLVEIRKEVPTTRNEAENYLVRLKELSTLSDPVRLVPLANRVLSQAPIYFDWVDGEFESQEEQVAEYYIGGARGFHFALEAFKSAVMFTLINRLDIAARLIRELDLEKMRLEAQEEY